MGDSPPCAPMPCRPREKLKKKFCCSEIAKSILRMENLRRSHFHKGLSSKLCEMFHPGLDLNLGEWLREKAPRPLASSRLKLLFCKSIVRFHHENFFAYAHFYAGNTKCENASLTLIQSDNGRIFSFSFQYVILNQGQGSIFTLRKCS